MSIISDPNFPLFFSSNPNFERFFAINPNFDRAPLGNSSEKRKRTESIGYELPLGFNILPKVQKFLEDSDVAIVVTLPLGSFHLPILPSQLHSSVSSPLHSSSPVLSPPSSPVLRPRKNRNPPKFIVDVLNLLLDSLPHVDVEELEPHDVTEDEEVEEVSVAGIDQNDEESEEVTIEDTDESVSVPTESIEATDETEVEISPDFATDDPEVEVIERDSVQIEFVEEIDEDSDLDKSFHEDASADVVTLEEDSIDNVINFFDEEIKKEYESAMSILEVPTEVISIEEDDEVVILSSGTRHVNVVPSTSKTSMVSPSVSNLPESFPSTSVASEFSPSSPSTIDLASPNTSLSSVVSISDLLESSVESAEQDPEPSFGRLMFGFNPEGFKKFAKQVAKYARVEIEMHPPHQVNDDTPHLPEEENVADLTVDDEIANVHDEDFAMIDEEDEVEECDALEFPLMEFPVGSEDEFVDEIDTGIPQAEEVARVVVVKPGSSSAVPTRVRSTYTRMKLMKLTNSLSCLAKSLPNEWVFNRELTAIYGFYLLNDSHYTDASIELRVTQPGWWLMLEEDSPAFALLMEKVDSDISTLVEFDGGKLKEGDLKMFLKLNLIKSYQQTNMPHAVSVQSKMIEPSPLFNPPEGQVSKFIEALPGIFIPRFRRLLPVQIFEAHQSFLVIFQLQQYSIHLRYHTEYLNVFVMKYGFLYEHMAGVNKLRVMVKNSCILLDVLALLISRLESLTCDQCRSLEDCDDVRALSCHTSHNALRLSISDNLRAIHRTLASFSTKECGNNLTAMFLYREDRPPKTRRLYINEVAKYVFIRQMQD